jgi:hypothetical protein
LKEGALDCEIFHNANSSKEEKLKCRTEGNDTD